MIARHLLTQCAILCLLVTYFVRSGYSATTYYIDDRRGKDSLSGTSEANAWKSIARINRERLQPGDRLLFKKGGIWRERLVIKQSGTQAAPIVFGSYGSGPRPIITALDPVRSWSRTRGRNDIWETPWDTRVRTVVFDEKLGREEESLSALDEELEFYWAENTLYVYSGSDPGQSYRNPGIEAGRRNDGILGHNSDYYTIDGLDIRGSNGGHNQGAGILLSGDHVRIINCEFRFNFYAGVHAADAADHGTIANCEIHHNVDNGIALGRGTGWVIEDSRVFSNGSGPRVRSGILFDTKNTRVSRCMVYDNGNGSIDPGLTHGIYVNPTARNVTIEDCVIYDHRNGNGINYDSDSGNIRRNYIYDNHFSGIHLENQQKGGWINIYNNIVHGNNCGINLYSWQWNEETRVRLYNNTVFNNNRTLRIPGVVDQEPYELSILSDIKELEIRNNIFYNDSQYFTIFCIRQSNMRSDNNCVYKSAGPDDRMHSFYAGSSKTFSEWQADTGGDRYSIALDPKFMSRSASAPGDFKLQCDSPCRTKGTTEVKDIVDRDFEGDTFAGRDMGAFRADCEGGDTEPPNAPGNIKLFLR